MESVHNGNVRIQKTAQITYNRIIDTNDIILVYSKDRNNHPICKMSNGDEYYLATTAEQYNEGLKLLNCGDKLNES